MTKQGMRFIITNRIVLSTRQVTNRATLWYVTAEYSASKVRCHLQYLLVGFITRVESGIFRGNRVGLEVLECYPGLSNLGRN